MALLAVSADQPDTRPRIPAFLKKHGLDLRILLDEKTGRSGYEVEGVPSLFVIDRKGFLAAVPTQFWVGDVEEKLSEILPPLLEGKPARGRIFLTLDRAPQGYRVLWERPHGESVADVLLAPAVPSQPSEIAALSGDKLLRWSASGEPLDSIPVREKSSKILAEDLDGDGKREWIVETDKGFEVKDSQGENYWVRFWEESPRIMGIQDLDEDGSKEILVQTRDSIFALKADGKELWRTKKPEGMRALQPDPCGGLLVKVGKKIRRLDAQGRLVGPSFQPPFGRDLQARLSLGPNRHIDLFGNVGWQRVDSRYDVDGDGRKDIIISSDSSLKAYGSDGELILSLRLGGGEQSMPWSAGDLDERPGDEIVLNVDHFGLVALSRTAGPEASAVTGR